MATVTVDNQEIEFEGRPKLLQLCLDHGIELPHFCYHPEMSIPANCRECLVEVGNPDVDRATGEVKKDAEGKPVIRFFPKLMTSCAQDVSDGMVVRTHRTSAQVRRAQKDTLEFLLLNHPLDCPICDQAGNCPLQNQAYKYGPEGSRFEFEKEHKPKRVELGPRVTLDAERCINCTRCTRFTSEISESHQLTIVNRGVRNHPMTPPGITFDDPYSMNVIDICPVGALTSTDFRFQARVWEMSSTPSITSTNAKGSNCYYWVKDNRIMKITSRTNMDVNRFWLADEDRLDYSRFNDNRLSGARISGAETGWSDAYDHAAELLKAASPGGMFFLGSAHACVEDNYLLSKLAMSVGAQTPSYIPHIRPGTGDEWLVTDDKTPNAEGCERLGFRIVDQDGFASRLQNGSIKLLYVLDDDPVDSGLCTLDDLADVVVIIHASSAKNQTVDVADVILPSATIVETIGTYVNIDGRAQRSRPARAIRGVNRTLMMEVGKSRADLHGTPFDRWYNEDNLVDCQPGWVSLPAIAEKLGAPVEFRGPKDIMVVVSGSIAAFSGVTYEAMGEFGCEPVAEAEAV